MDSGAGCTTLWMYVTPLNCTLKHAEKGKSYTYFTTMKKKKKCVCFLKKIFAVRNKMNRVIIYHYYTSVKKSERYMLHNVT